jgi:hypothetical protein
LTYGIVAQFKEIQHAYQSIIDKIESDEQDLLYDSFAYDVILVKVLTIDNASSIQLWLLTLLLIQNGGDEGLGILVTEDQHKRTISIKVCEIALSLLVLIYRPNVCRL